MPKTNSPSPSAAQTAPAPVVSDSPSDIDPTSFDDVVATINKFNDAAIMLLDVLRAAKPYYTRNPQQYAVIHNVERPLFDFHLAAIAMKKNADAQQAETKRLTRLIAGK